MRRLLGGVVVVFVLSSGVVPAAAAPARVWVAAWGSASSTAQVLTGVQNLTCRYPLRTTVAGPAVKVRLDNSLATTPAEFGAATIEPATNDLDAGPPVALTFGDRRAVALQPGDDVWSDPASLRVTAGEDLWVDLWIHGTDVGQTSHTLGLEPMGCAPAGTGDRTGVASGTLFPHRWSGDAWVNALAVDAAPGTHAVVALGDSLTDGACTQWDTHARWTDDLAVRLHGRLGVVNAGIAGDTVNNPVGLDWGPMAVQRWAHDVASLPGVHTVVVFEGTNDLQWGSTAAQLELGLRELVQDARADHLTVIGATLLPRDTVLKPPSFDIERAQVNADLLGGALGFDHVVDFDGAVSRDGGLYGEDACLDGVHLNATGYQALANAIPLGEL